MINVFEGRAAENPRKDFLTSSEWGEHEFDHAYSVAIL